MNKIGFFPITYDLLTLLKYKELLDGLTVTSICSFKEDRYIKQLSKEEKQLTITDKIDEVLEVSEGMVLLDNPTNFLSKKYQIVADQVFDYKKSLFLSSSLFKQLKINISHEVFFLDEKRVPCGNDVPFRVYENQLPVMAVFGMGENCSKLETILLSLKVLREHGLKVLLVGANPLLSLFGGYILPEYLFSRELSLESKVYKISRDLYMLQKDIEYDILLIEIPGGIVPVGEFNNNHFSEIPLTIANALKIDIGILNTYVPCQKDNKTEFFKHFCAYKYNIPLELVFMSRQKVEFETDAQKCEYLNLDDASYDWFYQNYCDSSIISLRDTKRCEEAILKMIKILEDGVEFI